MKKNEWKIGKKKKKSERAVWLGGRGGEKNSRAWLFSNIQPPQNGEKLGVKMWFEP